VFTKNPAFDKRTILSLVLCVTFGCADKTKNYTPSVSAAENALKQGLDAWQAGKPPGEIPGTRPAIQVVDVGRKPEQTLTGYRILGETRGPSGRTFAVSLKLANPDEELKTQYIVVGIDPLWVFRQDDYELLSHWDHHMPAPQTPEDQRPPGAKE
jgi:hypothetical protein